MGRSSKELARELLARRRAWGGLMDYIEYMELGFAPALHHRLLIGELEAVERGVVGRLMVFMPPGSAKSTYASATFPAWYLGRHPENSIIACSHTQDLAERFGRRLRNHFASMGHRNVFGVGVSLDNQAAGRWETERGGEYFASGVGGSITGRRADLGIIDDPVASREDADSERARGKAWDWYVNDFSPRLKPGGAQILIMCMVGTTPVLMSDGREKSLRFVRPGDMVATYDDGKVSASRVVRWVSQGHDFTYEMRMASGITVRANGRHPFLVVGNGERRWVRLRDLGVGDGIVRVMPPRGVGGGLVARKLAAESRRNARDFACRTTASAGGQRDTVRHQSTRHLGETLGSSIATASSLESIGASLMFKEGSVRFAESHRDLTRVPIGVGSSASITVTRREGSGDSCATTAISLSDTERVSEYSSWRLGMYEIDHDEIVSIEPCGVEEVFDIQVERTENFIANGLVSHNTRWHEDDLAGRILDREAAQWRVVSLPMEAVPGDLLGRSVGERLWPEWFTDDQVETAKRDVRSWNALYQQQPASEAGDYFRADWFGEYEGLPEVRAMYGASDYAVTEGGGDYTEHGVFALDSWNNIYIADWWRGQAAADIWIERQCDLILRWDPECWFGESGPLRRATEPFLLRRMEDREAYCRIEWLPSVAEKTARARPFQALASMGKVFVPKAARWKADLLGQLIRFPAGRFDDAVDVCSLVGRGLEMMRAPRRLRRRAVEFETRRHELGQDNQDWLGI